MIVIIGYGITSKGSLKSLYLGEDMDAAVSALEKAGGLGEIERGFIIKDAEPVFRHVYDAEDRLARTNRAARAADAARRAQLTAEQKAQEQAAAEQALRDAEADELERKAAALRSRSPVAKLVARRLTKKEQAAADKVAREQAEAAKAAKDAADKAAQAAADKGDASGASESDKTDDPSLGDEDPSAHFDT
jgi:hypothetical protein